MSSPSPYEPRRAPFTSAAAPTAALATMSGRSIHRVDALDDDAVSAVLGVHTRERWYAVWTLGAVIGLVVGLSATGAIGPWVLAGAGGGFALAARRVRQSWLRRAYDAAGIDPSLAPVLGERFRQISRTLHKQPASEAPAFIRATLTAPLDEG